MSALGTTALGRDLAVRSVGMEHRAWGGGGGSAGLPDRGE